MNRSGQPKIKQLLGDRLETGVFYGAVALSLPFLVLGGFSPKILNDSGNTALSFLTNSFSWLYLMSCSLFVLICLVIALSPLGKIKLGKDHEKPEFSF